MSIAMTIGGAELWHGAVGVGQLLEEVFNALAFAEGFGYPDCARGGGEVVNVPMWSFFGF